jgi:Holliday junction resolvase RusA-like endonuclease
LKQKEKQKCSIPIQIGIAVCPGIKVRRETEKAGGWRKDWMFPQVSQNISMNWCRKNVDMDNLIRLTE